MSYWIVNVTDRQIFKCNFKMQFQLHCSHFHDKNELLYNLYIFFALQDPLYLGSFIVSLQFNCVKSDTSYLSFSNSDDTTSNWASLFLTAQFIFSCYGTEGFTRYSVLMLCIINTKTEFKLCLMFLSFFTYRNKVSFQTPYLFTCLLFSFRTVTSILFSS
jgi:hypothetical protein